mgnify:CR=1 FL=1
MSYFSKFSNKNNSYSTSSGFYLTGNIYNGKHGESLELYGLEKGKNDNARKRTIVMHAAEYANKKFAEKYEAVYELINVIHQTNNGELEYLAKENIRLVRRSLENFHLSEEENFHISRMFRSTLHGFITLTQLGYFRQSGSISKEESFTYMVDHLLSRLDNTESI